MAKPSLFGVNYSARLQAVDTKRHGRFAALLRTIEAKTGCPVMVNTSFNVRGEPIVRTADVCVVLFHGDRHGCAGAGLIRRAKGAPAGKRTRRCG